MINKSKPPSAIEQLQDYVKRGGKFEVSFDVCVCILELAERIEALENWNEADAIIAEISQRPTEPLSKANEDRLDDAIQGCKDGKMVSLGDFTQYAAAPKDTK